MSEAVAKPRRPWQRVLANLRQRKVLAMLLLGFSSGLPIYLVGNTLGFWMRKEGIELTTIGFLSAICWLWFRPRFQTRSRSSLPERKDSTA